MTSNEYQSLAWNTAKPFYKVDTDVPMLRSLQLVTLVLALAGEAGELANKLKKMIENGGYINIEAQKILLDELGDVQWYVSSAAQFLDCPLEQLMGMNIAKLRQRYPDGLPNKMKTF